MFYILDGKEPVPCPNVDFWAAWMEAAQTVLARNVVEGGIVVSTVFLGRDQSPWNHGEFFETAIFYAEGTVDVVRRYATWDEACEGHITVVADTMEMVDGINKRLAVATAEIWKVGAKDA